MSKDKLIRVEFGQKLTPYILYGGVSVIFDFVDSTDSDGVNNQTTCCCHPIHLRQIADYIETEDDITGRSQMVKVYESSYEKYVKSKNEKNKYWRPWKHFDIEFLEKRLDGEIKEYKESKEKEELLDIINFAVFLYLKKDAKRDNI